MLRTRKEMEAQGSSNYKKPRKSTELEWRDERPKAPASMINGPTLPNFLISEYEAKVLAVDQQSYCYIQLCSKENIEERKHLQTAIRKLYTKRRMTCPFESIMVGEHMLGPGKDDSFRRVRVTQTLNKDSISCYDVDNHEYINYKSSQLFLITEEILKFPLQGFKTELHDLQIFVGTGVLQIAFRDLMDLEGFYKCTFIINQRIPSQILRLPNGKPVADCIRPMIPKLCGIPESFKDYAPVTMTNLDKDGYAWFQYENELIQNINQYCEIFDPENSLMTAKSMQKNASNFATDKDAVFFALFQGGFYRAKVLDELADGKLKIEYIDFGNTNKVNPTDLYPVEFLDKNLKIIPPQCFKTHLIGISNILDVDLVYISLNDQQQIRIKLACATKPGQTPEIDVILDNGDCLNSILLSSGEALGIDQVVPEVELATEEVTMIEEKSVLSDEDGTIPFEEETVDLTSYPKPYIEEISQESQAEIENNSKLNAMESLPYDDDTIEFDAVPIDATSYPEPYIEEISQESQVEIENNPKLDAVERLVVVSPELPQPGMIRKLRVTDSFSIDDISVQEIDGIESIYELENKMTTYYESVKNTRKPITSLETDGLYAFFSGKMGRWVRCRAILVRPGRLRWLYQVALRLIDYGYWFRHSFFNEDDWRDIQPLEPNHCELPQLGFTASRYCDKNLPDYTQLSTSELVPKGIVFDFWIQDREEISEENDVPHLSVVYLCSYPDGSSS